MTPKVIARAVAERLATILRLKTRLLLWFLAPNLVLSVVARHSLLLMLLYVVFFACGKFRQLFRGRILIYKHLVAWLVGKQDAYLAVNLLNWIVLV